MNTDLKVKLEDMKAKLTGVPGHFCDWYFAVNFKENEKNHFLVLHLSAPGLKKKNSMGARIVQGPLGLKKEESIVAMERPVFEVTCSVDYPDDAYKEETDKDTVISHLGNMTVISKVGSWHVRLDEKDFKVDLNFSARGPVVWWGNEPNELCVLTPGTKLVGLEAFCDVDGTATIEGKRMKVHGKGLYEHVWIEKIAFMEFRLVDWIFANFDELYTLLMRAEGVKGDGCPHHYETGAIYLMKEKKYLPVTRFSVSTQKWAFCPEVLRFTPIAYEVTAETEMGVLKFNFEASKYPQWIEKRRMEFLTIDRIPGWSFIMYDLPIECKGTFTYKDGTILNLTSGDGVDEVLRIFPLL